MNDGIPKSIQYASVDDAIDMVMRAGQGDIEHAYRNIPVHTEDRPLLAMEWHNDLYIDTVLPFGLRSAPKIFSAVADALEWILQHYGVSFILHYLDDFLTMDRAGTSECQENVDLILEICSFLDLPLKSEKKWTDTGAGIFRHDSEYYLPINSSPTTETATTGDSCTGVASKTRLHQTGATTINR